VGLSGNQSINSTSVDIRQWKYGGIPDISHTAGDRKPSLLPVLGLLHLGAELQHAAGVAVFGLSLTDRKS
jgi:hypothetical protein